MEYGIFFSIFLVGLTYGMTACMLSCMPFLTPLLVKRSNSVRESMRVMIPFSLGRIFTYMAIAVIATGGMALVKDMLEEKIAIDVVLGLSTILMGLFMLGRSLKNMKKSCGIHKPIEEKSNITTFGFFSIGATVSMNLCTPVVTLATVAGGSGSYYESLGLGLAFGIGAVLFSFLFYGFFMSTLIRGLLAEFASHKKAIEITASVLLIIVGLLVVGGKLKL